MTTPLVARHNLVNAAVDANARTVGIALVARAPGVPPAGVIALHWSLGAMPATAGQTLLGGA